MADLQDLEDILADFAVDAGEPQRRRERAGTLLAAGLDGPGLRLLADHAAKAAKGDAQRAGALLAYRLAEEGRWRAMLADLRRAGPVVAAAAEPQLEPYWGSAQWQRPGADEAEADHLARRAYCRAVADKASHQVVAGELGVALQDLPALIERGRVLQCAGHDRVGRPPENPEDARRRSQEADRQRREVFSEVRARRNTRSIEHRDGSPNLDALIPAMARAMPKMLDQVRETGALDMQAIVVDPVQRAAYATLTADALITQSGDGWPVVPHRAVGSARDRDRLIESRRIREQQDVAGGGVSSRRIPQ